MNKLIREEVDSPFIFMLCVCVCVEASAFLVCHRRSRVLSEPWPLPEDETLGKVCPHLRWICFFVFFKLIYFCFSLRSHLLILSFSVLAMALSWPQLSTSASLMTARLVTSWRRCSAWASSAQGCFTPTWRIWDWCQTYTTRYTRPHKDSLWRQRNEKGRWGDILHKDQSQF